MRKTSAERNYHLSDPKIVIKRRKFMTSLDINSRNHFKHDYQRNSYCVPISCGL